MEVAILVELKYFVFKIKESVLSNVKYNYFTMSLYTYKYCIIDFLLGVCVCVSLSVCMGVCVCVCVCICVCV